MINVRESQDKKTVKRQLHGGCLTIMGVNIESVDQDSLKSDIKYGYLIYL